MSQKEQVLNYLQKHKTITSYECFIKLNIVDLQKAIQLLRNEEYNISDVWKAKKNKQGKTVKYKEYRLEN